MAAWSFASSIGFWEFLEYLFESAVIVGCAGEALADFTNVLNVRNDLARKDWLHKISTVILLFGLAGALMSTIRMNVLAAQVIDVLDAKAKSALDNSDTALRQSKTATGFAKSATETVGKAVDTSDRASKGASNALVLAQSARREADSFEHQIAKAERDASAAEAHLSEAMQRARDASAELDRLKAPRTLTNASGVIEALRGFKGTQYGFVGVFSDQESIDLLKEIDSALQLAGWERIKIPSKSGLVVNIDKDFQVAPDIRTGVWVEVESTHGVADLQKDPLASPLYISAGMVLKFKLFSAISPVQEDLKKPLGVNVGPSTTVEILVGKKP